MRNVFHCLYLSFYNVYFVVYTIYLGDQTATISLVVPTVLGLNTHLSKMKDRARYCRALVMALSTSLQRRFHGIFVSCNMIKEPEVTDNQFSDKVYLLATVRDPQFAMNFVDLGVLVDGANAAAQTKLREDLKNRLEGGYCTLVSNIFNVLV